MKKYLILLLCLIATNVNAAVYYDMTEGCVGRLWCSIQTAPGECCPDQYVITQAAAVAQLQSGAQSSGLQFVGVAKQSYEPITTGGSLRSMVPDLVVKADGESVAGADFTNATGLYGVYVAKPTNTQVTLNVDEASGDDAVINYDAGAVQCDESTRKVVRGAGTSCEPKELEQFTFVYTVGANGTIQEAATRVCVQGEEVNLPKVTPIGNYEFSGWKDASGTQVYSAGESITCNSNYAFTAQYTAIQPKSVTEPEQPKWVKFNLKNTGATSVPSGNPSQFVCQMNKKYTDCAYGCYKTQDCSAAFTKITPPTRTNYVYDGHWIGSSRAILNSNGTLNTNWQRYTSASSYTITAKWNENTINLKYARGNCTAVNFPTSATTSCTVGQSYTPGLSSAPVAGDDQTHTGWKINGKTYSQGTAVTCNRATLGGSAGATSTITAVCETNATPITTSYSVTCDLDDENAVGTAGGVCSGYTCIEGTTVTLPTVTPTSQFSDVWKFSHWTVSGASTQYNAGQQVDCDHNLTLIAHYTPRYNPTWRAIYLDANGGNTNAEYTWLCCDSSNQLGGWYQGGKGTSASCNMNKKVTSILRPYRDGYDFDGYTLDNSGQTAFISNGGSIKLDCSGVASVDRAIAKWSEHIDTPVTPTHHVNYSFECDGGTCPDVITSHAGDPSYYPGACSEGQSFLPYHTAGSNAWRLDGWRVDGEFVPAQNQFSFLCPDRDNINVVLVYHRIPNTVNISYTRTCDGTTCGNFAPAIPTSELPASCVPGDKAILLAYNSGYINNAYYSFSGYTMTTTAQAEPTAASNHVDCPDYDMTINLAFTSKADPGASWRQLNVGGSCTASYVVTQNSSPTTIYCQMNDGHRACPKGCYVSKTNCSDSNKFTGLTTLPKASLNGVYHTYTGHYYDSLVLGADGKLTSDWAQWTNNCSGDVCDLCAKWSADADPDYKINIVFDKGNCGGTFTTTNSVCYIGDKLRSVNSQYYSSGYHEPDTASLAGTNQEVVGWSVNNRTFNNLDGWKYIDCTTDALGVSAGGTATITAVCETRQWRSVELQSVGANWNYKWLCCDASRTKPGWYSGGQGDTPSCNSGQTQVTNATARKDGYTFLGYRLSNGEMLTDDNGTLPDVCVSGTATAQWGHSLNWNDEFEGVDCARVQCPYTDHTAYPTDCVEGTQLTVSCASVAGYDCNGWIVGSGDTVVPVGGSITCPSSDTTITVKYTPAVSAQWAKVTLDDNGGTGGAPATFWCQGTPNIDGCSVGCYVSNSCSSERLTQLTTQPTRDGYVFDGYWIGDYQIIGPAGQGLWSSWNTVSAGENNVAVAHWTKDRFNFDANCGNCDGAGISTQFARQATIYMNTYCSAPIDNDLQWSCTYNNGTRDVTTVFSDTSAWTMPNADTTCTATCTPNGGDSILYLRGFHLGSN